MEDIQGYIEIVKKEIHQYFSTIMENKYEKNMIEPMVKKYVDVRYFNIQNIVDKKDLRKVVLAELEKETQRLSKIYKKEIVFYINEIFSYIVYFDNVGNSKLENVINKIIEVRKEKLNINTESNFDKKLIKLVLQNKKTKSSYIEKFFVDYFKLKIKKTDNKNIQLLKLTYNIVFPKSVSSKIIQQAFETDITCEDKLIVEYHMLNAMILEDVIKGKFNEQYIVEFATSLLSKKSKLERILKLISSDYQKERINLMLEYKDFTDDIKNEIYDMMRQGYKMAIKLDESFNTEESNINKLDVFSYVIVNDKLDYCEQLLKNKKISRKILKN